MADLPEPLVPPEVDLRDFPYMPVDMARLFGSEFHAAANDAEWRAGFTLWLKSYHQVPASSIPRDEAAQARLAELGRDTKLWLKLKIKALRGWRACSDGRLYHPVVAEKALEAWIEKLGQRKSSAAGNATRYKQAFDPRPFDAAIRESRSLLAVLNPNSRVLLRRSPVADHPGTATDINRDSQQPPVGSSDAPPIGTTNGSPDNLPSGSQGKGSKSSIQIKNGDLHGRIGSPRPPGGRP